jgi:hypothetical protein
MGFARTATDRALVDPAATDLQATSEHMANAASKKENPREGSTRRASMPEMPKANEALVPTIRASEHCLSCSATFATLPDVRTR